MSEEKAIEVVRERNEWVKRGARMRERMVKKFG